MKAEIKSGNLIVTIPLQNPELSKTGKTLVVASSRGNQVTSAKLADGRDIIVGLNAYVYAQPKA